MSNVAVVPEHVLVFKRNAYFNSPIFYFNGYIALGGTTPDFHLYRCRVDFIERPQAEHDPSYKQIIPYVVIMDHEGHVFTYQRSKMSGENRLMGKWSIGIGGHINPFDSPAMSDEENPKTEYVPKKLLFKQTIINGAIRELTEEVHPNIITQEITPRVDLINRLEVIGFVNDDSDAVGRVHFGIVMLLRLNPNETVTVIDKALVNEAFLHPEYLLQASSDGVKEFEKWSVHTLAALNSLELFKGVQR